MSEKDSTYYDDVYSTGGHNEYYFRDSFDVPIYSDLWKEAAKNLLPNTTVIDLGCGPGQFAEVLCKTNPMPYNGYDFSNVAIIQALTRELPECTFKVKPLEKIELSEDSTKYQYVCLEVLEHIGKDRELLLKLPKNASIVLSVPTYDSAGHIRTYPSIEFTMNRYKDILDMKLIKEFVVIEKDKDIEAEKIFLFKGTRK